MVMSTSILLIRCHLPETEHNAGDVLRAIISNKMHKYLCYHSMGICVFVQRRK